MRATNGLVSILISAVLISCGGGGGGGASGGDSGGPPLVYVGRTDPAIITTANAAKLTFDVIGAGSAGTVAVVAAGAEARGGASPHSGIGVGSLGRHLKRSFVDSAIQSVRVGGSQPLAAAIPVDTTTGCDSGSVRVSGTLSDAGTGTLAVSFNACRNGSDTLSGAATLRIDAIDLSTFAVTDSTIAFLRLTIQTGTDSARFSGSIRLQVASGGGAETTTLNLVFVRNSTGEMGKADNLVYVDTHFPSTDYPLAETVSGRVFDSEHGYVDVATNEPLFFSSPAQQFPHPGQLMLVGAANQSIQVTTISSATALVELDLDGDGGYEYWTSIPWPDINGLMAIDFIRPTAPEVSVRLNGDGTVTLSWSLSLDSSGIREYRILRSGIPIGRTTDTFFVDRSVQPGSVSDYYVRAVDSAGNVSDRRPPVSVSIPAIGTGSFSAPITSTLNFTPDGMGVADVNGDGFSDLVLTGGGIATALGPITGGVSLFSSPPTFPTMSNAVNLPSFQLVNIVGNDLPEALGAGSTLVWNTSSNLWESGAGDLPAFPSEPRVYIDVNDDGILDIVTVAASANSTQTLSATLGRGDGSYDASSTRALAGIAGFSFGRIGAIVAVDADRDGLTDLVIWNLDTISVVRQMQRGRFGVIATLPAIDNRYFRAALAVADVTGDGYPDIIYADYSVTPPSNQLRVYVNDGSGKFGSTAVSSNISAPWNFAAADINGDGIPDMVVSNNLIYGLDVHLSNGDGTFTFVASIAGLVSPYITLADVDGDGSVDIVAAGLTAEPSFQNRELRIYLNR